MAATAASGTQSQQDSSLWTQQREDELVELWRERPCLSEIKSPECMVKKSVAIKEIAEALGFAGL